jgi:hypothetical protein
MDRMDVFAHEYIEGLAKTARSCGACLRIECPDGGFDLIEPEGVKINFLRHSLEARDLDNRKVEIPLANIVDVKIDP